MDPELVIKAYQHLVEQQQIAIQAQSEVIRNLVTTQQLTNSSNTLETLKQPDIEDEFEDSSILSLFEPLEFAGEES
jgi:hypothetical protein